MRIGHGYDVHAFEAGDSVVLGGVRIPHNQSLKAHSDGDVAIHALCDALLGAAGLGDIGRHFPDHEPAYKDIDSRQLLIDVGRKIAQQGYTVVNVDITLVAQKPILSPHIPKMRACLAADLALETASINIKATTTEKLGFVGREEGIAAHALVLITASSADQLPQST